MNFMEAFANCVYKAYPEKNEVDCLDEAACNLMSIEEREFWESGS